MREVWLTIGGLSFAYVDRRELSTHTVEDVESDRTGDGLDLANPDITYENALLLFRPYGVDLIRISTSFLSYSLHTYIHTCLHTYVHTPMRLCLMRVVLHFWV